MNSKLYKLFAWENGNATLTVQPTPGRHKPTHEFHLMNNGAGFDVFDVLNDPHGMPVAVVPDLPAALSWAMTTLTINEKELA